jgi:hypothetical protein
MPKQNTLKKQCNIVKYLQKHHEGLAEAISDLCLEGSFSARKGGVTFILPNKTLEKKIIDATYSNNPEEAVDLINASIIPQKIDNPSDFPQVTGNKLGKKLTVDQPNDDDDVVTLNGGALKIRPVKGFTSLRDRNIALWQLESGEPITSPEAENFDFKTGGSQKRIRGRGEHLKPDTTYSARQQLMSRVQNAYTERVFNKSLGKPIGGNDQAQKVVSSLANRIYLNAEEEKSPNSPYTRAFTALASVWDKDPQVMASILLNPDPQLSNVLKPVYGKLHITGGLDAEMTANPSNEYANYSDPQVVSGMLNNLGLQSNIPAASQVLSEKRKSIANRYNQKGAVYDSEPILNAYRDLYVHNKVVHGGKVVDKVFPDNFISALAESESNTTGGQQNVVYNALARDMLRHTLALANRDLENEVTPTTLQGLQREVAQNFSDAKTFYGSADAQKNASLFTSVKDIKNIGSRAGADALRLSFLNSTDFLYLPSNVATTGGGSSAELNHVYGGFYNREAVATRGLAEHKSIDLSSQYQKLLSLHS